MEQNMFFAIVVLLMAIAVLDLIVGVSNDAVNFLNSSIGSRVASRRTIFIIAGLGLLAGVLFSSGIMEVARKGIFHPQFFTMPELMTLFLAVMLADLLILDLFNTYGLPTSTTVSIVFELLGAAVALSLIKILSNGQDLSTLAQYINTATALTIISGILLSVVIAFVCGALAQFVARVLFTFDYEKYLKAFGGLWSGICVSSILLFIMMKGTKGAALIPKEILSYIEGNLLFVTGILFVLAAIVSQILISAFRVNIFKPVVLMGTFSLALAFAANDLVNFVGVPIASLHAYNAAFAEANPLTATMGGLAGKVPTNPFLLLACGVVMVLALWFSRKARTVTETEVQLSSHTEDKEQFESLALSRVVVRIFSAIFAVFQMLIPRTFKKFLGRRFARPLQDEFGDHDIAPSFDLVRASTNLMMASILVSFATSLKLPLSTTYVTFMVAMGTSFADLAWGRDTAVYRVTGVLTVIGGWFVTAVMAFVTGGIYCAIIYYGGVAGGALLIAGTVYFLWSAHWKHKAIEAEKQKEAVFNLKKITDVKEAKASTFTQVGIFLKYFQLHLDSGIEALLSENRVELKTHYLARRRIQRWSNIIAANVFKVMRLMHLKQVRNESEYSETVSTLQALTDAYRDIVVRAYEHVRENHKGLLSVQKSELEDLVARVTEILHEVEQHITGQKVSSFERVQSAQRALAEKMQQYSNAQDERIHNRSSKTRLSILYFAILVDVERMAEQAVRLFEVVDQFLASQSEDKDEGEFSKQAQP